MRSKRDKTAQKTGATSAKVKTVGAKAAGGPAPSVEVTTSNPTGSLWRDTMGNAATRSIQTLAILAVVVMVIFLLTRLTLVAIPIVIALILAAAMFPVVRKLRSWGFAPALAAATTLLGTAVVIGGVVTLIVNAVRNQWSELADSAVEGFHKLQESFEGLPFQVSTEQFEEFKQTATDFLTSSNFGSTAVAGISATGSFLTGLFLLFVVLFFFLKDGPQIWEFLLRPFEGESYARARRAGGKTVSVLGHYIRGTASVAAVDALGIGLGLVIIGVPLALPLSVIVFLTAFIPLVGATFAGILAALVALVSNGPIEALLVLGVVILVNQLEGNFLQPVLMGRSLSLHPLVILLALTVGTVTAGILGAVLSVPIAAVIWGVMNVWDGPNTPARLVRKKPQEEQPVAP